MSFGNSPAKSISCPTITVTGAARIFGLFASAANLASVALASALRTQTKRCHSACNI
jgi:hypothetical protein